MHLRSETALDYLEGKLETEEEVFWNQHLPSCNSCLEDVARWRQLGFDLQRRHLKSAPERDTVKAISLFPDRLNVGARMRRVLAAVIFDSSLELSVAGVRGSLAASRHVVLRAEEFDIHVKIWGEPDHLQLLGQLLPRSGQDFVHVARFHLLRNGERLDTTAVDETGEFRFSDVPNTDLSLQIDLPKLTVIGSLNVRQLQ